MPGTTVRVRDTSRVSDAGGHTRKVTSGNPRSAASSPVPAPLASPRPVRPSKPRPPSPPPGSANGGEPELLLLPAAPSPSPARPTTADGCVRPPAVQPTAGTSADDGGLTTAEEGNATGATSPVGAPPTWTGTASSRGGGAEPPPADALAAAGTPSLPRTAGDGRALPPARPVGAAAGRPPPPPPVPQPKQAAKPQPIATRCGSNAAHAEAHAGAPPHGPLSHSSRRPQHARASTRSPWCAVAHSCSPRDAPRRPTRTAATSTAHSAAGVGAEPPGTHRGRRDSAGRSHTRAGRKESRRPGRQPLRPWQRPAPPLPRGSAPSTTLRSTGRSHPGRQPPLSSSWLPAGCHPSHGCYRPRTVASAEEYGATTQS
ncbi:hypothetical protein BU14_0287s0004, partial [Porphyra umbilicalis]